MSKNWRVTKNCTGFIKNNAYQPVIQEIVEITNYINMREYNPNMRENNSHIPENKPFFYEFANQCNHSNKTQSLRLNWCKISFMPKHYLFMR